MTLEPTPTPVPTIASPAVAQAGIQEATVESCQEKANELLTNYLSKCNALELKPYMKAMVSEVRGRYSLLICANYAENAGELTEKRDAMIRRMLGELKGAYPLENHIGQSVQFGTLGKMDEFLTSANRAFEAYRG